MAALKVLDGAPAEIVSCAVSAEVFERLADDTVPMAVLPIENSLHGSVFEHYDLLLAAPVRVIGETQLRIHHNVIAAPGVRFADIRRVLSHPVALSQCRRWLRNHPHIEAAPCYDTAGSVKQLMAQGLTDTAGIAPQLAATQYGGKILVANIEDHSENYTRFYTLVAESDLRAVPDANKASLAFSLEHRPGSLIEALAVFQTSDLNLTRIESRPVPGSPWEYVFFVDLRFDHVAQLDHALAGLHTRCQMVRELGRYKAAEPTS
jgi:prephenate dehydratase